MAITSDPVFGDVEALREDGGGRDEPSSETRDASRRGPGPQGEARASFGPSSAAGLPPLSGVYVRPRPGQPLLGGDELRLDVDGSLPQMVASGVQRSSSGQQLHWVARLSRVGADSWQGGIFYKDGAASLLPHTTLRIRVSRSGALGNQEAEVTFDGTGAGALTHVYQFKDVYFDRVEFEFDATADAHPVYQIDTRDHPNRPSDLPLEPLTIEDVFRRTGFNVSISGGGSVVPIAGAGIDRVWSDTEMHDAMQVAWSRFADRPQWALWVFSAALHEEGGDLGGIMFDSDPSRRPHRQGTAIFTESFIKDAPAGDPAPAAFIRRTRFWTAVHEMGHAFNLAHSWQKSLGTSWISVPNESEARSFMNYPLRVAGRETAFYSTFRYRFSDQELLFMRHAPRRFVQMGNADWFDDHAFENAATSAEPELKLELRLNRQKPVLDFLEPAMVELKVTNVSGDPMVVDAHLLQDVDNLTLVVKRDGVPARVWQPFARRCMRPKKVALAPGESLYHPLFTAVGSGGWLVAEPGWYTLQASLELASGEDVVSAPLRLKVLPPRGYEDEVLAQDFFTQGVGRLLAFDGTREASLDGAADTLRLALARDASRPVAAHAAIALAMPLRRSGKVLRGAHRIERVEAIAAQPEDAQKLLQGALSVDSNQAARTLGHIEYREYAETLAGSLADTGDVNAAHSVVNQLESTLQRRNVKPAVLQQVQSFAQSLDARAAGRKVEP